MRGKEKEQKEAFLIALQKHFKNDVIFEQKKLSEISNDQSYKNPINSTIYKNIFEGLKESLKKRTIAELNDKRINEATAKRRIDNGFKFDTSGAVDYLIESKKLIIEYDERQHFSPQRQIALENYPDEIKINYDKQKWILICKNYYDYVKANKHYNKEGIEDKGRVEQRAYYDSVRDIEASKAGYKLIRIKHKDFDWINNSDEEKEIELKRLGIT